MISRQALKNERSEDPIAARCEKLSGSTLSYQIWSAEVGHRTSYFEQTLHYIKTFDDRRLVEKKVLPSALVVLR